MTDWRRSLISSSPIIFFLSLYGSFSPASRPTTEEIATNSRSSRGQAGLESMISVAMAVMFIIDDKRGLCRYRWMFEISFAYPLGNPIAFLSLFWITIDNTFSISWCGAARRINDGIRVVESGYYVIVSSVLVRWESTHCKARNGDAAVTIEFGSLLRYKLMRVHRTG